MTTPNLAMPEIAASQAQKHVTHNEALAVLDAIVQLSAKSRTVTDPPGSPSEGQRWIVPSGATGAWAGKTSQIASYTDAGWTFYPPKTGWTCFVEDEGVVSWSGGGWKKVSALSGSGASIGVSVIEEEVTLAGAAVDTTIAIPDRAIVLAVSVRTTAAITGATSYNCGIAGDLSKFGGSLGVAPGSTNIGVIGPTAYYASTPVRLSSLGGNFTGGKVRVAIQCMTFTAPGA